MQSDKKVTLVINLIFYTLMLVFLFQQLFQNIEFICNKYIHFSLERA